MRIIVVGLSALSLAGCFEKNLDADSSAHADAEQAQARLTGDDKRAASDNAVCNLFKARELEAYVGEPLGTPENAAMGSGCQWPSKDEDGDVTIQIVGADYYEPHKLAETYTEVAGIGSAAFTEKAMGGWLASARFEDKAIVVMVAGEKASVENAEALLRETAKRVSALSAEASP